jgi:hypothetical protein
MQSYYKVWINLRVRDSSKNFVEKVEKILLEKKSFEIECLPEKKESWNENLEIVNQ